MKEFTVVVTTFRRLENARNILDALRNQSVKPTLFLWDNAEHDWDCGTVDWRIHSIPNSKCFGRWWMLSQAETDYIMSIDDDLIPTDPTMLEKIGDFLETNPGSLVGPEGVVLNNVNRNRYSLGKHYPSGETETTTEVDVIKGRLMAMTPQNLKTARFGEWGTSVEDDLLVNTFYARKVIPSLFFKNIVNLPEGEESLWKRKDHYRIRDEFVEKHF